MPAGSPRFRPGNRQPDGTYPPIYKPKERVAPMLDSELAGQSPSEGLQGLAGEALATIAQVMRSPGRNAQSQLAAAKLLLERSIPMAPTNVIATVEHVYDAAALSHLSDDELANLNAIAGKLIAPA